MVMTRSTDQEELKRMLVRKDSDFYLMPSRKIGATYKIVYCRLGGSFHQSCKVDVLTPGIMNIPDIIQERIFHTRFIPVMPFIPLLLLKLQAWSDHRNSDRFDMRQKQYTDVSDIKRLLEVGLRDRKGLKDADWLPELFIEAAKGRVTSFCSNHPESAEHWRAIGFPVSRARASSTSTNGSQYNLRGRKRGMPSSLYGRTGTSQYSRVRGL